MDASERDQAPMLPASFFQSDRISSKSRALSSRSASMSMPMNSEDFSASEHNLVGFTGPLRAARRNTSVYMSGPLYDNRNREVIFQLPQNASRQKIMEPTLDGHPSLDQAENSDWPLDDYAGKNEHLLRSGQLGICNDPYCTTCPVYYNIKGRQKQSRTSEMLDPKLHDILYGDAKGCAKRLYSRLLPYIPGVMNPHTKLVQRWNKFFVISCLVAVFLDPLFFFLLLVDEKNKCIVLNWPMTTTIVVLRSMTDFIYLMHMLLQFRLAYVAPETTVVGAGELVDNPVKIAKNYLFGYFIIDLFVVLPLPQIIILLMLPASMESSGANYAKNVLRGAILVQYVPRLSRFLPLIAGPSATGFIFESAWSHFIINLLTYVLASHVVGSCWYLFGLQRVNQCFRDACQNNSEIIKNCTKFIDCGHGTDYMKFREYPTWELWKTNTQVAACLGDGGGFDFGIYKAAVKQTQKTSLAPRYLYSLFWGFQQISTLAGNQIPSDFEWEVLFTMFIIGMGLLLFALLIGNIQNFLQALGRRNLEMSLRRRDVEQWMTHRCLPEDLRRRVHNAERFTWVATRGVNEEKLMENLPEDLQRDIRHHLFQFVKKVWIFKLLDEDIVDAICERLRTKTYIQGSKILYPGGVVDNMVFIIRGNMHSTGEDKIVVPLREKGVCGEELLSWCLENSSSSSNNKDARRRIPGPRLLSNRLVTCLTNVEAFVLRSADLEEVTSLFARSLRSPRVQGAIRYISPYWRGLAVRRIQVAWRYRKKRISRGDSAT